MFLDKLNDWIGRTVAWLTLAMVLVTVVVVVARYGFRWGSIALQESVTYMHATVFMLGAAYALKHDMHVRVDIFYRKMTARTQAWVDFLGALFLLVPTCVYIFWVSLDYVSAAWAVREGSREAGGLPLVYVLKSLMPAAAVLLLLEGTLLAVRRARQILGREAPCQD
ncbi:MAG: TRAP transporter small permease subunit [Xanthomonadales bacterium]|nr:TRAP transporter small permease subunit [Xanthomonadales bacterium]